MSDRLPSSWSLKPLSDVAYVISGGTPSRDVPEFWNPAEIEWVTPTDITRGKSRTLISAKEKISRKGLSSSSAKLLPVNTVLMTSRATLGEMKVSGIECCTNQGFKSLIPKQNMDVWFLYYQMMRKKPEYEALGIGSTFLEVNKKDTDAFEIECPPFEQQQKIAKILSTVDNLIEKTQTLIDKYTAIKQGMMADLFTRGIDMTTGDTPNSKGGKLRPSAEDAPELYKQTELGWAPKEWAVVALGEICHKVTDGSHQAVQTTEDGSVPFLFVSSIRNGRILWNKTALITREDYAIISKGREPKKGDVLYTAVGSYGYAACVDEDADFSFQRHIAYIKPDSNSIDSTFLTELLNSEVMKRWADRVALGNAQKTVTLGELSKYPVLLPDLEEQDAMIKKLSSLNRSIELEAKTLEKYNKTKIGLMQDLLTGKVRVN